MEKLEDYLAGLNALKVTYSNFMFKWPKCWIKMVAVLMQCPIRSLFSFFLFLSFFLCHGCCIVGIIKHFPDLKISKQTAILEPSEDSACAKRARLTDSLANLD